MLRKVVLTIIGFLALAAVVLGVMALDKASGTANTTSALRAQLSAVRTEAAHLRSDLKSAQASLRSDQSALSGVRSRIAKTTTSANIGYCVQYFSPQDGNVMSYNVATGNDDYTNVYELVEGISTPYRVNGVWECPGGGSFVPMAQ